MRYILNTALDTLAFVASLYTVFAVVTIYQRAVELGYLG